MDKEQVYKDAAEKLWGLLDDIDTLTDIIKPTSVQGYVKFYQAARVRTERRHLVLVSDGYSLHVPKECAQKIVEENKNVVEQANYEICALIDNLPLDKLSEAGWHSTVTVLEEIRRKLS